MNNDLLDAIARVHEAAREAGVTPILVGALVTALAAERNRGLPAARGTHDADFALRVSGWGLFEAMRKALLRRKAAPDPQIEHRFRVGEAVVDLLPYGPGVATPDGKLRWPASEFEMSVVGFEEACAAATDVRIAKGITVRCVTVPGLVLLKIVAFVDRSARQDPKHRNDAEDILYWLKNYASGDDSSRRFDLASLHLDGVLYENAGAAVLGLDVKKFMRSSVRSLADRFLSIANDPYGAFANAVIPTSLDDKRADQERERIARLLTAFRAGLEAHTD
jgi:predicted nucleotidyltransferase